MRAKFINEASEDILKPISKDEFDELIQTHNTPTIFIDEGHYDEWEPEEEEYDGVSDITIYGLPNSWYDDGDMETVEKHSNNRYSYPVLGKARVGFVEGSDFPAEIISIDNDDIQIDDVNILYPPL